MADSGIETQTIESIELKVDDNPNEDHIDIGIEQLQVTEETGVIGGNDEDLDRDEIVVVTDQDFAGMSESSKERSTEVSADNVKTYEEWIFVDVNNSTFEIKENLLLLSSVYGNDQACCSIM